MPTTSEATSGQPEGSPPGFSGDLTDMGTLKRLLARHGMAPNKGLGQHLLISRRALNAVVSAADLSPDDNVLEVGAGPGVLTRELAQRARRVVAVELDRAVLPVLRETTAGLANVEIIPRNLLEVDPEEVFGAESYKLVANLPYYITSLILRYLLESANPPQVLVVMVQREVAERLVAGPGEMSLLSLSVQFYGTPKIVGYVPATAFYPPPKVDSAIVRVDLHPAPLLDSTASDLFFELIHAGFAEKRKQLHNSLTRHLDVPRETIDRWLAEGVIDSMRRPQTLSLEEWLRLARIAAADAPH
ncbi:MAG: 16S rRNA (adenine(1518)-N(6)/adenine(1519)-N(6))-dimethyltransferase RsmA [Nitrososphaerota archaeon]